MEKSTSRSPVVKMESVPTHAWLEQTDIPKLMFYTDDAALLTGEALKWCLRLKSLTSVNLVDCNR